MHVGISLQAHGRYCANVFRSSSHRIQISGWNQYKLFILVISNLYMNKYNTRTIDTTIGIVITTLIFLYRTRFTMWVSLVGCSTVKENFHYLRIQSVKHQRHKRYVFLCSVEKLKSSTVMTGDVSKLWNECDEIESFRTWLYVKFTSKQLRNQLNFLIVKNVSWTYKFKIF